MGGRCAFEAQPWEQLGEVGGGWKGDPGSGRGGGRCSESGPGPVQPPSGARRVGARGQMFPPPPHRAQVRTCKSGTRDLKAPGAPPGPASRGVAAALWAGAAGESAPPGGVRGRREARRAPRVQLAQAWGRGEGKGLRALSRVAAASSPQPRLHLCASGAGCLCCAVTCYREGLLRGPFCRRLRPRRSRKLAPVDKGCAIGFGTGLGVLFLVAARMGVVKGAQHFPSSYCARVKSFHRRGSSCCQRPRFTGEEMGNKGAVFPLVSPRV